MANVWVEVLDTPIDGHQKGEVFEIDEHYADRFVEHEKAKIVDAPEEAVPEPETLPTGKAAAKDVEPTGRAAEVANPKKSA